MANSPEYEIWRNDIGSCTAPNGESVKSVYERIPMRLLQIAIENEGKTIAIATHALPIRCVISKWMGLGLSGMKLFPWAPNASVTEVTFENDIFIPALTIVSFMNNCTMESIKENFASYFISGSLRSRLLRLVAILYAIAPTHNEK